MSFRLPRLLMAVIFAAVLAGCVASVPLQRAQVDSFRVGDNASTLQERLGKSTPLLEHNFEYGGSSYVARHFNLQTGTRQSGMVMCTPICMYIPTIEPVYTPFVIVMSDQGRVVRAYGTLEELSKSTDDTVSGLMPVLKTSMEKAQAEKKKV